MPLDGRLGPREAHSNNTNHTTINRDVDGEMRGGGMDELKATIIREWGGELGKKTTNHVNSHGRRGRNKHTTINLIKYKNERLRLAGEEGDNNQQHHQWRG